MNTAKRFRRPARWLLSIFALAALIAVWIDSNGDLAVASIWSVPIVLELLVVSWPWRTISVGTVALAFLLGTGPIFVASILAQNVLAGSALDDWLSSSLPAWFGTVRDARLQIFAPVTEEVLKIAVVVVLFAWPRAPLRTMAGPLDLALIAAATGAGLGLSEDLLRVGSSNWNIPTAPIFGLGLGAFYLGVVGVSNWAPSFPDWVTYVGMVQTVAPTVEDVGGGVVWAGHALLPLTVGLSLGFAALGARRTGTPLPYVVPLLVFLWVVAHHVTANSYTEGGCGAASLMCVAAALDIHGRLIPLAAVAGWIAATYVSHRILRAHRELDGAMFLPTRPLDWKGYVASSPAGALRLIADLLTYLRLRRRVGFAAYHLTRSRPGEQPRLGGSLLATRTSALLLAMSLVGETRPTLSPRAEAVLERATPKF